MQIVGKTHLIFQQMYSYITKTVFRVTRTGGIENETSIYHCKDNRNVCNGLQRDQTAVEERRASH